MPTDRKIRNSFRYFILGTLLFVTQGFSPLHAQGTEAEQAYQQFLQIYRSDSPTRSDLEAALGHVKNANQLAPNTYKFVFSLGAINTTLKNWEQAVIWLEEAKKLTRDEQAIEMIDVELKYCQTQLARLKVANWGPDPVKVSFVMKRGTVEMSSDMISKLPQVLPQVSIDESEDGLIEAIRKKLPIKRSSMTTENGYLIVSMDDEVEPAEHYRKGIKDFHKVFTSKYFDTRPKRWLTVMLAENPYPLVEATRALYPSVGLPIYAPFLGYYNPSDNLIMATSGRAGYGTLLHEMIHALIAADFPNAPAWLNEGLASLYERTQWSNSQLHALPNWRMDGLRESNMPSLADLVQQASEIGLHSHEIAAIRLLFLYLDQQNLMDDLYLLAKQGSPDFTLSQGVTSLGLMEAGWQEFLKETFSSYRAELARNKGALSHPDEIRFVQQALKQTVNPGIKVDGHWGQQTQQALMEFQRQNGLDDDGILGPKTASTLREVYQKSRVLSVPNS